VAWRQQRFDEKEWVSRSKRAIQCYSQSRPVFRTFTSSLLSALVVVTLLWGGCISCSQFFMFTAVEKNCCDKAGQCKRPTKSAPVKECKRMPLEPQGFAAAHSELAAALVSSEIPVVPVLAGSLMTVRHEAAPVEHSPPDLNVLHSTFLI
jgi:hypothetical protein